MKPVTIKSTGKEILRAFKASPYWMQLTKSLQKQAAKDPVAWLEGHPYLFFRYPAFFRDISGLSLIHVPITLLVIVKPTRRSTDRDRGRPVPRKRKAKH